MIEPGNLLAIIVMLVWPLVIYMIFRAKPLDQAIVWSMLSTALVLPVSTAIKLPLFPNLDKIAIAAAFTFLFAFVHNRQTGSFLPKSKFVRLMIFLFIFSPVVTVLNNGDPQIALESSRPGLGLIDLQNIIVRNMLSLIAFVLGYRYLSSTESHANLVRIFVISGLVYSVLVVYELRMSPRLHSNFYGYFPHDWRQQMRDGGFRSVVFLGHGLLVSIFMMVTVIAAVSMWKQRAKVLSLPPVITAGYLFAVLIINKSMGAVVFAVTAITVMVMFSGKMQLKAASVLALICIFYPLLRWADVFPTDILVETAAMVNETRASSLAFRFNEEIALLDRASERPIFGWGIWGRSRPMTETSGRDTAVTDGQWLLTFGEFGLIGYMAQFGLLGFPVLYAYRRVIREPTDALATAGISLIVAFVMLDQLPNASLAPWLWLMSGALLGFAERKSPSGVQGTTSADNLRLHDTHAN